MLIGGRKGGQEYRGMKKERKEGIDGREMRGDLE
jgi:hypothetical protein